MTIRDVATAAGVSVQTVSRVLNDRPDVSPATYQRIRAILDEVGFAPNAFARSLIHGRSYALGIVAYGLDYFGPSRILTGIDQMAGEIGYSITLDLIHEPETREVDPLLTSLLARQVDGIIWAVPSVGPNRTWVQEGNFDLGVPIVLVGGSDVAMSLPSISIDNRAIGRIATEHLLVTGGTRVGIVTGPLAWWEARERKAGWLDALVAHGMSPHDSLVVEGDWTPGSGRRGLDILLERDPSIDAVFASNDQMAVGVLHAAHARGIRIPEELAVVGVDDIAESSDYWPPLTTVHQPLQDVGAMSVGAIDRALSQVAPDEPLPPGSSFPASTQLAPTLVVRRSTRAGS